MRAVVNREFAVVCRGDRLYPHSLGFGVPGSGTRITASNRVWYSRSMKLSEQFEEALVYATPQVTVS